MESKTTAIIGICFLVLVVGGALILSSFGIATVGEWKWKGTTYARQTSSRSVSNNVLDYSIGYACAIGLTINNPVIAWGNCPNIEPSVARGSRITFRIDLDIVRSGIGKVVPPNLYLVKDTENGHCVGKPLNKGTWLMNGNIVYGKMSAPLTPGEHTYDVCKGKTYGQHSVIFNVTNQMNAVDGISGVDDISRTEDISGVIADDISGSAVPGWQ